MKKPSERMYGGRPTKWNNLSQFYEMRNTWADLYAELGRQVYAQKASPVDWETTYCWRKLQEVRWIEATLDKANSKQDPLKYLNQINVWKLHEYVESISVRLSSLEQYIETCKTSSLAESPGNDYFQKWPTSKQDLWELVYGTPFTTTEEELEQIEELPKY